MRLLRITVTYKIILLFLLFDIRSADRTYCDAFIESISAFGTYNIHGIVPFKMIMNVLIQYGVFVNRDNV